MKQHLIDLYLDYVNNYLTVSTFSEHKWLDSDDAMTLIDMGRKYHEENVELLKS